MRWPCQQWPTALWRLRPLPWSICSHDQSPLNTKMFLLLFIIRHWCTPHERRGDNFVPQFTPTHHHSWKQTINLSESDTNHWNDHHKQCVFQFLPKPDAFEQLLNLQLNSERHTAAFKEILSSQPFDFIIYVCSYIAVFMTSITFTLCYFEQQSNIRCISLVWNTGLLFECGQVSVTFLSSSFRKETINNPIKLLIELSLQFFS